MKDPLQALQPLLTLCRRKRPWWLHFCVITPLSRIWKKQIYKVPTEWLPHNPHFNSPEEDTFHSSGSWFSQQNVLMLQTHYSHSFVGTDLLQICLTDGWMGHKTVSINHPRSQQLEMKLCWTGGTVKIGTDSCMLKFLFPCAENPAWCSQTLLQVLLTGIF